MSQKIDFFRMFDMVVVIAVVLMIAGLTLTGCVAHHHQPANIPLGKEMGAPIGAVDFCKRNPQDELCHEE